jgi:Fur family peroxide stress response transcriptional regulator
VRYTSQRYAILEYLLRNRIHPTAEEIHNAINQADPRASLATVYKALHAMAKAGLIRELCFEGGAIRFEAYTDPHHHFVCERCKKIEDIGWFDVPEISQAGLVGSRAVTAYRLIMYGICEACKQKQRNS